MRTEGEIDISGVDVGILVAALYNGTRAAGPFGLQNDLGHAMSPEEGRVAAKRHEHPRRTHEMNFDWLYGRPLKVTIDLKRGTLLGAHLYDRESLGGAGSCATIVSTLRPGCVTVESVDQHQISE